MPRVSARAGLNEDFLKDTEKKAEAWAVTGYATPSDLPPFEEVPDRYGYLTQYKCEDGTYRVRGRIIVKHHQVKNGNRMVPALGALNYYWQEGDAGPGKDLSNLQYRGWTHDERRHMLPLGVIPGNEDFEFSPGLPPSNGAEDPQLELPALPRGEPGLTRAVNELVKVLRDIHTVLVQDGNRLTAAANDVRSEVKAIKREVTSNTEALANLPRTLDGRYSRKTRVEQVKERLQGD